MLSEHSCGGIGGGGVLGRALGGAGVQLLVFLSCFVCKVVLSRVKLDSTSQTFTSPTSPLSKTSGWTTSR